MAHRALELNMKKFWKLWAKALGEKVGDDNTADRVALLRTAIVMCYIITNLFIIAGVIRHW
jgi:hypothetical protein